MKTLTNPKIKVNGAKVTIEFDIVDKTFDLRVVQQVTATHVATNNPRHFRHIQISHEAFFIKRPGTPHAVAFDQDAMVDIATAIVPQLSYAPIHKDAAKTTPQTVTVVFDSELNPTLQWQSTPDIKPVQRTATGGIAVPATWTDIPGATEATLDLTKTPVPEGHFVRCVATSEAGMAVSNPPILI
jgi:hypothetical protein